MLNSIDQFCRPHLRIPESIGIGAQLPPSSVELTSKLIDSQIQFYEDEIVAMRTDANYLWHKIFENQSHGPGTALFSYFVTLDKGPSPPKRITEFSLFYGRAFRAEVYHAYHFLSVWTWVAKAFEELKSLGYTTKTAERDIVKNPKIHNLILQIKGVCLTELCQDLSNYFRRALASSARYGRYFDIEWVRASVDAPKLFHENLSGRLYGIQPGKILGRCHRHCETRCIPRGFARLGGVPSSSLQSRDNLGVPRVFPHYRRVYQMPHGPKDLHYNTYQRYPFGVRCIDHLHGPSPPAIQGAFDPGVV